MERRLTGQRVAVAAALAIVAVACGSSRDSAFGNGTSGSGGPNGTGFDGTSGGPGSVVSPTDACATSNAGANLLGVSLVFMFDRSTSMLQDSKWTSCKAGLTAFFADPSSKGMWASMGFFPQSDGCNVAGYGTPAATIRALPDAASFSTRLELINPGGDTPTLPALQGAIQYAQTVRAGLQPGEKVFIVLVTDGEPNGCNSTADNVADEAKAVSSTIPTYVIGVGPNLANLNKIAAGGGTKEAIIIPTSNPGQITADLEKALGQIKQASLGCNYGLPAPPSGKTIDVGAVNVNYTPGGGGALSTLPYSPDCSKPNGWHYDIPAAPTQVVMCPTICGTLKADAAGGAVNIVFGCATLGAPPK